MLVCYLPVGSEEADEVLRAVRASTPASPSSTPSRCSSPATRSGRRSSTDAGVPIVGDDIKSQVGATITHRVLAKLFEDRGVALDRTYQLNVGGNMDFMNMLERERLESKKISKTQSVTSQIAARASSPSNVHIGPSDYVPWLDDRKWAYVRLEGRAFGDVPLNLEYKLEVWDSPELGRRHHRRGPRARRSPWTAASAARSSSASSYFMKSPPVQYPDDDGRATPSRSSSAATSSADASSPLTTLAAGHRSRHSAWPHARGVRRRGPPCMRAPGRRSLAACASPATCVPCSRHRDFRRLFATRLISQAADGVFQVGAGGLVVFSPERADLGAAASPPAFAVAAAAVLAGRARSPACCSTAGAGGRSWSCANLLRAALVLGVAGAGRRATSSAPPLYVAVLALPVGQPVLPRRAVGAPCRTSSTADELVMANALVPDRAARSPRRRRRPRARRCERLLGDGGDADAAVIVRRGAAATSARRAARAADGTATCSGPTSTREPARTRAAVRRVAPRPGRRRAARAGRTAAARHALAAIGAHRFFYGVSTIVDDPAAPQLLQRPRPTSTPASPGWRSASSPRPALGFFARRA